MKNNIPHLLTIAISLVLFSLATHAQYTTIKTPTNVTVEAIVYSEYSSGVLAQLEEDAADWIDDHDSDAERVAPASRTYNCHNYAWHNSDGGNRFWVNQYNRYNWPNISKYWSGSSATYQQSSSVSTSKVFYSNGDHSARVISSNLFESKWGAWPRYRHSPTDCPYVSSNLQYYKVLIDGDDIVCSSETYSTINISGATYS
ncbi:MAG: hypothetical protein K9H26_19345 [Prolixibacteraceae bacterium]|nr:hypothetical protein [Prolixibacteraceae bacterium]